MQDKFEKDLESYIQKFGIQCEGNGEPLKVFGHGRDGQTNTKCNVVFIAWLILPH